MCIIFHAEDDVYNLKICGKKERTDEIWYKFSLLPGFYFLNIEYTLKI